MKYLCLAYYNEKEFEVLSKTQVDAIVSKSRRLVIHLGQLAQRYLGHGSDFERSMESCVSLAMRRYPLVAPAVRPAM